MKSFGVITEELTGNEVYPMKNPARSYSDIARTSFRKICSRYLLDNVFADRPSRLWLGWFTTGPNPKQIRLNGDNCRTVRKIPRQTMEQAECLVARFPIELGDNGQGCFGASRLGITRQYSNSYV